MLKQRLENLADAMFPIIMTLLVIEIKIPEHLKNFSENGLLSEITHSAPLFFAFLLSFSILVNLWFGHLFLFTMIARSINRRLAYMHMAFMGMLCFLPYSTHLLGEYPSSKVAICFYAIHMFLIYSFFLYLRNHVIDSEDIENASLSEAGLTPLDWWYGTMRIVMNLVCSILAIIVAFFNTYLAIALIVFTVFIHTVPGMTQFFLKKTGLQHLLFTKKINKN
ncbi:MAG: TMEM175 family protein [Patescibacteria group bacterium]